VLFQIDKHSLLSKSTEKSQKDEVTSVADRIDNEILKSASNFKKKFTDNHTFKNSAEDDEARSMYGTNSPD
jgi:hypothetical protein